MGNRYIDCLEMREIRSKLKVLRAIHRRHRLTNSPLAKAQIKSLMDGRKQYMIKSAKDLTAEHRKAIQESRKAFAQDFGENK